MAETGGIDFRLVVAVDVKTNGIGRNGDLPWKSIPEDMKHFKSITMGNAVVMGRKTFDSIPRKFRPLQGRKNVVITRSVSEFRARDDVGDDVLVAGSFLAAEELLREHGVDVAYVIGGADIYKTAMENSHWSRRAYVTEVIGEEMGCDVFLPQISGKDWRKISLSETKHLGELKYRFVEYVRASDEERSEALLGSPISVNGEETVPPHDELQYLNLVRQIIDNGHEKGDRTGTGTLSVFGAQMRFDLRTSFPLLTTKRVFWRGVAEELLWFLRGSTDAKLLSDKNIRIWDGNGSREFLDNLGFQERREGDLGPVYGFQWRHFGADYEGPDADYSEKGVDQLIECIETIKTNPNDRRIIMSAWNPVDLKKMALPPCHMICQFYVANGELSCHMYQRSCDMGLGVPFNIASYALLTYLVAHECNLKPGDFVHTLGDAHVYANHVEALKIQLERKPKPFPQLVIKDREGRRGIEDYEFSDLEMIGYDCHKTIKMDMAV
ncbi:hypothetical protein NDN08_003966 [Rhodosorus marinus]|uniref:Bifunctional dihydrofolate reductase-thymidylate synthase n=1 Tax=Rhodosorus marinus TaxID=101924 RepID=A0AAV8UGY1_9RHOD|nr:hypothetical protein NDN08_003966 [Rhodosorus marinus]